MTDGLPDWMDGWILLRSLVHLARAPCTAKEWTLVLCYNNPAHFYSVDTALSLVEPNALMIG